MDCAAARSNPLGDWEIKSMKTVVLFIDTSSNEKAEVALEIDGKMQEVTKKLDRRKAQIVLPMINTLLKKNDLSPLDLTGIEVKTGPGSFTGLRVGVSIANTLGMYLEIPITGHPPGVLAEPDYS